MRFFCIFMYDYNNFLYFCGCICIMELEGLSRLLAFFRYFWGMCCGLSVWLSGICFMNDF